MQTNKKKSVKYSFIIYFYTSFLRRHGHHAFGEPQPQPHPRFFDQVGHQTTKGGFKSENLRQFFGIPKNIPKNCLVFVHPVHDNDKMSIINFFDFTSLINLQVYEEVSKGGFLSESAG